ncbi:hypothetical protein [Saccharothrix sp. HUAS TT1]|uniref:hypothetical protein n=1 Tax=unclassified Saccharothrix TaxID=2593673 RepID=UPI00345C4598
MSTPPTPDRHPLARVARAVGTVRAVISAVLAVPAVAVLVATDLPAALDVALAALVALLATLGPLLGAFGVKTRGETLVTPVADPRDNEDRQLVPVEAGPGGAYNVTGLTG